MNYSETAHALISAMIKLHRLRPFKQIEGLAQGEAFLLQYLAETKGEISPGEISAVMDVSTPRITAALKNLEKKGLIMRRIDPADHRRFLVSLSAAGKTAAEKQHQQILDPVEQLLRLVGEKDAGEYLRILQKIDTLTSKEGSVAK